MRGRDGFIASQPAYSPDLSPLDASCFGQFQEEVSYLFKTERYLLKHSHLMPRELLRKITIRRWTSIKYTRVSKSAILRMTEIFREVLRREGDLTGC